MKNFIHIITTRFNVPTKNWFETREGKTPLTEEWHEHRFKLFLNFTYPSFKNQSNKEFIWMVFFDVNTLDKYKKIIKNIELEFPNFKPYFITHGDEINSNIRNWLKDYFNYDTKFLISTDIDNDDVLHKDFVQTVQKLFRPQHDLVIDLRRGLQISIDELTIKTVNEYYGVANPFVSYVEDISLPYKTIMNEMHLNFRNYPHIVSVDDNPLFIQIIHHYNLLNNTFKTKQLYSISSTDYGFSNKIGIEISWFNTILTNALKKLNTVKKILSKK